MEKQVKYGTKEYNEAYKNNQLANKYNEETDTYELTLPEVKITPRNNLNLGNVIREGTSKFIKPAQKAASIALDFSPLSPALATGRFLSATSNYRRTGNKPAYNKAIINTAFEALPFINVAALKTPIKEADNLIKTITKEKFGIDKISLSTPRKGIIADIELSPADYNEFGKTWMHPEYINVTKGEQGKGLSNVLYAEG